MILHSASAAECDDNKYTFEDGSSIERHYNKNPLLFKNFLL